MAESQEYKDLFILLAGGNQTKYGHIFGQANEVVLGCPGLREDLQVCSFDFSEERVFPNYRQAPDYLKRHRRDKMDLKAVEEMLSHGKIKCPEAVEVYVLAKKKVSIIITNNGQLQLLGAVVVGDHSGICEIVMFNDAMSIISDNNNLQIESVYNCISTGDRILICGGAGWINGRVENGNNCAFYFNREKILEMEIKLNVFDARKVFVVKDIKPPKVEDQSFHLVSLAKTDERFNKLWTATDILHPENNGLFQHIQENSDTCYVEPRDVINFDVIGIIKHAGRLERRGKWKKEKFISCQVKEPVEENDSEVERLPYQQYSVYRWLELIDLLNPEGEPVKLRIVVNDMKMWKNQENLMPGSLVVITYCIPHLGFMGKWISTSQYSEIFCTRDQFADFNRRMPLYLKPINAEYHKCSVWKNLVKVTKFTIGGAYLQRICHEEYFEDCKPKDDIDFVNSSHHPRNEFRINEVQRVCFTGKITKIKGCDLRSYNYSKFRHEKCVTGSNEEMSVGPLISYDSFLHWTGTRELPKLFVENLSSAKEIMDEIAKEYEMFAECLFSLFTGNLFTKSNLLRTELLLADRLHDCIVEIKTEDFTYHACWYGIWESKAEMDNRLEAAYGKDVNVLIDIQKLKNPKMANAEFEVIVHDFMIAE